MTMDKNQEISVALKLTQFYLSSSTEKMNEDDIIDLYLRILAKLDEKLKTRTGVDFGG